MTKPRSCRTLAAVFFALFAVAVPTASAASLQGVLGGALTSLSPLTTGANPCQGQVFSQPFLPWKDASSYFPVANGNFENGAVGWDLYDGAKIVSGGNPYLVGNKALDLPAGSEADAPATCVNLLSPTLRLFASGSGSVEISVVSMGKTFGVGTIYANGTWAPTASYLFVTNLLAILSPTGASSATFVFTAWSGDVKIDDVYVDPYRRT
jgi:hypothetical protein